MSWLKPGKKQVKVGWFFDPNTDASFIYGDPMPVMRDREGTSVRALQHCPAAIDFDRRYFAVPCPVDATLHLKRAPNGDPMVVDLQEGRGGLSEKNLNKLIHVMPQEGWRHPDRPLIQFSTPYRFVTDDDVYINQLPPFLEYQSSPWPGVLIGGRFPLDVWPRTLMWAFEWYDTSQSVEFKSGEPWFYVSFDTNSAAGKPVRLVKAEVTDTLLNYCRGLDGVTGYVNRTFSLFKTARSRRPKQLLVEAK